MTASGFVIEQGLGTTLKINRLGLLPSHYKHTHFLEFPKGLIKVFEHQKQANVCFFDGKNEDKIGKK